MLRRFIPLLLASVLLPVAAFGQGDSSLFGMVLYRGGEAANARVYVGREGKYKQVITKFRAGKNIGYRLEGLNPGRYELLITATGAQARRAWGVKLGTYDQREINVTLDRATTPEQEHFYLEHGVPANDDLPRPWEGGWLQGSILSEAGRVVDGKIKLLRGPTTYREIVVGTPTLPAYYEHRDIMPGTYDLEYEPRASAGLKRLRVEKVVIAPRARTILGTLHVPAAGAGDPIVTRSLPERTVQPIR